MTMEVRLGAMYEDAVRELAEIDAYRQRLIGRCDLLRELVAAGLGEVAVPEQLARDGLPLPEENAVSVHETRGV